MLKLISIKEYFCDLFAPFLSKHEKWTIVFLFGMDDKRVSSFQVCDASQADKVENCLKCHEVRVFARPKTEITLSYRCEKKEEKELESKIIGAFRKSLIALHINDGPCLVIKKDAAARMAEAFLLSKGMKFAKIKWKTPTFKDLAARR